MNRQGLDFPVSSGTVDGAALVARASVPVDIPNPLRRLEEALGPGPFALVILFVSPDADLDALALRLPGRFGGARVVGCSTAGEISAAGYAEGDGVQTMVDGGRYEGQFSRSRQHGEGTFYAPDGSIFKGEWKNGKPHGNGTFRTPEGRVTRGTWVDGVFQAEEPSDPNRT